jgi:dihydrofolate synthase/folylpolyglutamate synthase
MIAGEKAGIIKHGIPVVIGETQPSVQHVFIGKAEEKQAPVFFADEMFVLKSAISGHLLKVVAEERGSGTVLEIHSPLTGNYQAKNIITVLGAARMLNSAGFTLSDLHLASGIRHVVRNTGIQGRWQVLAKSPLTVCDTGHNEGGLREVVRQIRSTPHDKLHVVFGAVEDKDLTEILKLLPPEAMYYFCKADVPRGLDAVTLATRAIHAGLTGRHYSSVKAALAAARLAAQPDDLIFIGGSTFVVAEII